MQRILLEDTLKKTGIMMIDGSMSTALEELGCQLNDSLWTAKILAGEPEKVRTVHYNYFAAGADWRDYRQLSGFHSRLLSAWIYGAGGRKFDPAFRTAVL